MPDFTYLFYDIESSGLNPAFDQILQFAAIRTNSDLEEIERETFLVQPRRDVVLSPGAAVVHRICPADAARGLSEYAAVSRIYEMLNTPRTISIGYNSIAFDDIFLRFAFYRNLLPPYRHQYDQHCFRMDLLPITLIYHLFEPAGIAWPETGGRPSLKLEALNAANQLAEGRAHDALTDVEATVALARRFKEKTAIWDYLQGAFLKPEDRQRFEKLPTIETPSGNFALGLLVDIHFGHEAAFLSPAICLGDSLAYKNQQIWLQLDQPALAVPDVGASNLTFGTSRKKRGEPPLVLPPLRRYLDRMAPARIDLARENKNRLIREPALLEALIDCHRNYRYPEVPEVDMDAALYTQGFPSSSEEKWCQRFHRGSLDEKMEMTTSLPDSALKTRAVRLLGRNFEGALTGDFRKQFDDFLDKVNPADPADALVDYKGVKRFTPSAAWEEMEQLTASNRLDDAQNRILEALKAHLKSLF